MLPNTDHIPRLDCPKCSARMLLMRIMPRTGGAEVRMFECPKCEHVIEQSARSTPSPKLPGLQAGPFPKAD